MKERPILFSAPMVRAILDGTKTQTRRIVKPQPLWVADPSVPFKTPDANPKGIIACPYGQPGDRLWVKETWKPDPSWGYPPKTKPTAIDEGTNILYRATIPEDHPKTTWQKWRPCLFMRRWMSRITLEVVSVRVERLQDISEEDALAEGVDPAGPVGYIPASDRMGRARYQYSNLWESINGPGSWDANPWVWVVTFNPDPSRRA